MSRMSVTSVTNLRMLLLAAACAFAAALIWATTGHAAKTAATCPSVPAGATLGYTAAGTVGSSTVVQATPVRATTSKAATRRAHRLARAKRHATSGTPGQMPPYITKQAADPACVPTPGAQSSGSAPTPAP